MCKYTEEIAISQFTISQPYTLKHRSRRAHGHPPDTGRIEKRLMNVLEEIGRWRPDRYQMLITGLPGDDVIVPAVYRVGLVRYLLVGLVERRRRPYPEVRVVLLRLVPGIVGGRALDLAASAALAEVLGVDELLHQSVEKVRGVLY